MSAQPRPGAAVDADRADLPLTARLPQADQPGEEARGAWGSAGGGVLLFAGGRCGKLYSSARPACMCRSRASPQSCKRHRDRAQGVESLRGLRLLQYLSLHGVVRLSDKGLLPLAALTALRGLELGHTRVRDEGLGSAARLLPGLRSLSLVREEVGAGDGGAADGGLGRWGWEASGDGQMGPGYVWLVW